MPSTDAIVLRGVSRTYGEELALRDVSLSLGAGRTLVVLGPNGAGKTTLLRILATLLRPSAGEASVLGCELPREGWRARGRIGFLGHDPLLYRELTAAENLAFQARLHGLGDEGAARARSLLEAAGMADAAAVRVGEMSAGMRQRVAACRALLHRPDLLLLDEPAAHLDPGGAERLEALIGPGSGLTRVLVTHDPEAGLAEADEALVLRREGSVAFAGPVAGIDRTGLDAAYERGAPRRAGAR